MPYVVEGLDSAAGTDDVLCLTHLVNLTHLIRLIQDHLIVDFTRIAPHLFLNQSLSIIVEHIFPETGEHFPYYVFCICFAEDTFTGCSYFRKALLYAYFRLLDLFKVTDTFPAISTIFDLI